MAKKKFIKHKQEAKDFCSTITNDHYSLSGEHPDDRIRRDKEYISRLIDHTNSIVKSLVLSLKFTPEGEQQLLDYMFEKTDTDFEEYLQAKNLNYEDMVTSNKWFHN